MLQSARVSIVDDDREVRTATARLLRSFGHRVVAFASAEAFLASAESATTDCVIADIQMPGLGGVELQRVLLGRPRTPPMIFITAFSDDRVREQVLAAGAVCLLKKPFDGAALARCLASALGACLPK